MQRRYHFHCLLKYAFHFVSPCIDFCLKLFCEEDLTGMEISELRKKITRCGQTLTKCLNPSYAQMQKLYFCCSL